MTNTTTVVIAHNLKDTKARTAVVPAKSAIANLKKLDRLANQEGHALQTIANNEERLARSKARLASIHKDTKAVHKVLASMKGDIATAMEKMAAKMAAMQTILDS